MKLTTESLKEKIAANNGVGHYIGLAAPDAAFEACLQGVGFTDIRFISIAETADDDVTTQPERFINAVDSLIEESPDALIIAGAMCDFPYVTKAIQVTAENRLLDSVCTALDSTVAGKPAVPKLPAAITLLGFKYVTGEDNEIVEDEHGMMHVKLMCIRVPWVLTWKETAPAVSPDLKVITAVYDILGMARQDLKDFESAKPEQKAAYALGARIRVDSALELVRGQILELVK